MRDTPEPQDHWLWGWDATPGIVSVWAEPDGHATVWRRDPATRALVREDDRYRPWLLLANGDDAASLGRDVEVDELAGPGELRFRARAGDLRALTSAVLRAASRRLGHGVRHVRELPDDSVLLLPPDEQYLVATGRVYFRDLAFDDVRRLCFDLETTGLDAARDRIFLAAIRDPDGTTRVIEASGDGDSDVGEAQLIAELVARIRQADPDVIENHNLHGFDLPFLDARAKLLGVPLALGRAGPPGLGTRAARRGVPRDASDPSRRIRHTMIGRELIDSLDAVLRHDFSARDLPGHGLKQVAQHLGLSGEARELVPGGEIHAVWRRDPARVARYAIADVEEAAALGRVLGGAGFALARMVPRRYERCADAGAATGILDPLLVRAYVHAGEALPARARGDGTEHTGAGLHLFAAGVARRVVKADVASLYPSLMRAYRIGPARDRLGALLALVDRLVAQRLAAKAAGRAAAIGSNERWRTPARSEAEGRRGLIERFGHEAMSAAMKLVVNSAYGYLGAGSLTRFADVHAANEVTRRGREVLDLLCRELAARGTTLLEADTDGVYFAVPGAWGEADERRCVAEVAALLPALVTLEYDGRYAAMLSHEPKNYALLGYDGSLTIRGVAFRSSRAEPYGEAFLRAALARVLVGDVAGVRDVYLAAVSALRARAVRTFDVTSRVRLTKTPEDYLATRDARRELPYEAVLASGRTTWSAGERVRVYRALRGQPALLADRDEPADPRDYDIEHYVRLLRETYATRFVRALDPDDYAAVFADPDQLSLFARPLADARPVLTILPRDDVGASGFGPRASPDED